MPSLTGNGITTKERRQRLNTQAQETKKRRGTISKVDPDKRNRDPDEDSVCAISQLIPHTANDHKTA